MLWRNVEDRDKLEAGRWRSSWSWGTGTIWRQGGGDGGGGGGGDRGGGGGRGQTGGREGLAVLGRKPPLGSDHFRHWLGAAKPMLKVQSSLCLLFENRHFLPF